MSYVYRAPSTNITIMEILNFQRLQNQGYVGGKVVKPYLAPALGKYTPYFEDGQEELNVTARIGSTVVLDCEIGMLGNKTVSDPYLRTTMAGRTRD